MILVLHNKRDYLFCVIKIHKLSVTAHTQIKDFCRKTRRQMYHDTLYSSWILPFPHLC